MEDTEAEWATQRAYRFGDDGSDDDGDASDGGDYTQTQVAPTLPRERHDGDSGASRSAAPRWTASATASSASLTDIIDLVSDGDNEIETDAARTTDCGGEVVIVNADDDEDDDVIEAAPVRAPQQAVQPAGAFLQTPITEHFRRDSFAVMMAASRRQVAEVKPQPKQRSVSGRSASAGTRATGSSTGTVRVRPSGGGGSWRPRGPCPFYKKVPGTPFVVDGFMWASPSLSSYYALSHFHSDHTQGLTQQFDAGHIYCSAVTAALVALRIRVAPHRLRAIPLGERTEVIPGVALTLLDANHCPGM